MYTIINNLKKENIIKKSKFISFVFYIENEIDAINIINKLKTEYENATHLCYAYITNNVEKMSDDKEPSGTAGKTMLDLLKKKKLNNVLGIVIRYFGGIKLGANGLIRAYSNSLNDVITNNITELIEGYNVEIEFSYSLEKEVNYLLKDTKIITKLYKDTISYNLDITEEVLNKLKKLNIKLISTKKKKIKASDIRKLNLY